MSFEEPVLTYTPNYRAKLSNIVLNKKYSISNKVMNKEMKISTFSYSLEYRADDSQSFKIMFKWEPKEGETKFNLNTNITIIDYILFTNNYGRIETIKLIDNYGNIHIVNDVNIQQDLLASFTSSIIENKEGLEILSDQVIDFIIDNNVVCNPTIGSDYIKQIQKIAGTGKEKKITYTIKDTCETRDITYDRNDIIKDIVISFPGEDPWEKADDLYDIYESKYDKLNDEHDGDIKLLKSLVHTKNNIMDLITRNKDIDDEDILELIEIKKLKLTAIERQIDDLLEKNSTRYEEIIKLKLLISKLELIPEKDCGTDFI